MQISHKHYSVNDGEGLLLYFCSVVAMLSFFRRFFFSKNYRLCKDLLLTTSVDRATRLVDKKIFQKLLIRVLPLQPDSREQPVMTDWNDSFDTFFDI